GGPHHPRRGDRPTLTCRRARLVEQRRRPRPPDQPRPGAEGSKPRSNSPCPGSSNSSRARATSSPSSASVCADPTWATIRRRPSTYSAICTAVAPEAVRTRRIHATDPTVEHQLVPQNDGPPTYRRRSASHTVKDRDAVTKLRTYSAICTADAPEAALTRRIHAIRPTVGHQSVPQIGLPRTHRR